MKKKLFCIVIYLMCFGCCRAEEPTFKGASQSNKAEISKQTDACSGIEDLYGKWFIKGYQLAGIGSMSEDDAKNSVGRVCIFSPDSILVGESFCSKPTYKLTKENTVSYLRDGYKIAPYAVNIKTPELFVVQFDCEDQRGNEDFPYEIFLISKSKVILPMEGAFFILKKE